MLIALLAIISLVLKNSLLSYYDSRELPSSFNVNNNTFWTAFLLVQSKNDVYSCLIVPSKIST